jgi:hypothetical protein
MRAMIHFCNKSDKVCKAAARSTSRTGDGTHQQARGNS